MAEKIRELKSAPVADPTSATTHGTGTHSFVVSKDDPRVHLTMAISDYDHVRDLTNGRIQADGIHLNALNLQVEEIFYRFTKFAEWEVSEMSMGKYVSLISQGDTRFSAIPVFPSRVFRHSSIYVLEGSGIESPEDLVGRRVGVPEWAQTASIYTRGLLMHDYGVPLTDIEWVQAGVNQPGRVEKVRLNLPQGLRYASEPSRTLDEMLLSGDLAAIMTAHPPESFKNGDPRVRRLFRDYRTVEQAYWKRTGIFPIMHVVAIRTDVLDRHPWIAMNLLKAFEEAKRRSVERAMEVTASRFPIPWVFDHASTAGSLFEGDYWPYGVDANRTTLEAYLRFAFEQGVCHRALCVEDLFPPQILSSFKV